MACGCKKRREAATLNEPIKQPAQSVAPNNINESSSNTEQREQKQIVDAILDKLKQINK